MHLQRIEAHQFRNLTGSIDFSPGLNVLYGANAQGKSNWLEAIYLLATTKSFRTAHPPETIRHQAPEAILRGTVACGNLSKDIQLLLTKTSKQTFVNGKREAVTRYLGTLDAIAFTADEMTVVRGAPEARRRFLDRGIVSTLPAYLGTLAEYNRVLKQKNRLLRDASQADDPSVYFPLLQPWNDQLVAYGVEIHTARTSYVERLRAALKPQLFQAEEIAISYRSSLAGKGDLSDYAQVMRERLVFHLRNEVSLGYSLVGPHRDDLEILSDGYEIARFGSSGQQRSALLILDLAQMLVYHQVFEEYPVFLVDDIDAELDRRRIEILLDYLDGKSQTFVSTSKQSLADRYRHRAATFQVAEGRSIAEGEQTSWAAKAIQSDQPPEETELPAEAALEADEIKHRAPF
jgi:DNA replication and repair protein RecF